MCRRNQEVAITAGRRDPICPPDQTLALEGYFRRQGADTTVNGTKGATICVRARLTRFSDGARPADEAERSRPCVRSSSTPSAIPLFSNW
jgi:hypothetical protein